MKTLNSVRYEVAPVRGGYTDQILELDLSSLAISTIDVEPVYRRTYVGGRGYAIKMIWDQTTKETRYDSPENILVMASGPLGNEPRFPGTGKFVVATISPLTDTFIDSNIGGHFAPLLKMCGFDALAIKGISREEVVLIVDGDEGTIAITEAPSFGKDIDAGGLRYGEALIREFTGGQFTENVAAVFLQRQGLSTFK